MSPPDRSLEHAVLAIACGGTGGHFYPGVSIGQEFQRQGGKVVLFIGGHHAAEQLRAAAGLGLPAVAAPAIRLPRGILPLAAFPFKLWSCRRRCRALMREHGVTLALGMGSYASVPLGLAARLHCPLALHEGNAGLGQANRFLSRWARVLGLSFPLQTPTPTRARQVVVGMPIRDAIVAAAAWSPAQVKAELAAELKLDPVRPLVFIFGGSQGAPPITNAVREMLPLLAPAQREVLQFIHFTGQDDHGELAGAYAAAGLAASVKTGDPQIERYYLAADYIICRAGASTIAELAVLGKAPLMIPYPGAKEDHQAVNARLVVDVEGGWMIAQRDLTPGGIREHLERPPSVWQQAGEQIRRLARPRAAAEMVAQLPVSG